MDSHQKKAPRHSIPYRPDIDGLRAVAVICVVLYHAFPPALKGGFVGVDIFFVISGFLISSIILKNLTNNTFSFVDFYIRRARRIFPALFVVLAATLLFGWFALFPDEFRQLGKHVLGGAGFISNLLYWQESGYFDTAAKAKPLLHLWSLGIEEQFYLLFPVFMYLGWKKKIRPMTLVVIALALSFALNIALHRSAPAADFYSPMTRFWELLCGVALAVLAWEKAAAPQADKRWFAMFACGLTGGKEPAVAGRIVNSALSVTGLVLLLLSAYLTMTRNFPGIRALLPVAGAMLIILAGPAAIINRTILSCKPVVFIGLISYPLYLWHWPIISYLRIINGDLLDASDMIAAVLMSLLLSGITYALIEKPIRFGVSKDRQGLLAVALCGLMAAVGAFGGYACLKGGFPKRFDNPELNQALLEALEPSIIQDAAGFAYAPDALKLSHIACRYTDAGSAVTVALIGDSHAHSAYPAIARYNAEHGVNTFLLAMPAWRPLLTAEKTEQQGFAEATHLMLATLTAKPDIHKVFIFSRGPVYWTGTDPSGATYPVITPYPLFKAGLQRMVSLLAQEGKTVYVVTDNPELPTSIRNYLPRPFRRFETDAMILRRDYMERHASHLEMLQSLDGAIFVNSTDAFCPTEQCRLFDDAGLPLYCDESHLSIAGSEFLLRHTLQPHLAASPVPAPPSPGPSFK